MSYFPFNIENSFNNLAIALINNLKNNEYLTLELSGENSHFIRFNKAKVRQTGIVFDSNITIKLIKNNRTNCATFPLTGDQETDLAIAIENLTYLQKEISQLPEDDYLVLPENKGSSKEMYEGELLDINEAIATICTPVQNLDFTGYYTAGNVIRANYNSLGQKHWFYNESFFLDYSLINASNKAVKRTFADKNWCNQNYQKQIEEAKNQLLLLEKTPHELKKGNYRTYFAPSAVADLINMFSWGAISEASIRQGGSALNKMRDGQNLSPKFSLQENFTAGNVPRFNDLGEITPVEIPLITNGKLINTLISSRTAKEYKLTSNYANSWETWRSPELKAGNLKEEEILTKLNTGLYLSNLHYLNWSDIQGGRITGMTRYACFWVKNGEIIAPIQDLRFDDSLYNFLGQNLIDFTQKREFIPHIDTYEKRSIGGLLTPGLLADNFAFTL